MVEEHSTTNILNTHPIDTECIATASQSSLINNMPTANDQAVTPPTINAYAPPPTTTENDSSDIQQSTTELRPTIIDARKFKEKPSYSFDSAAVNPTILQNDLKLKLKSSSVDYSVSVNGDALKPSSGDMTCSEQVQGLALSPTQGDGKSVSAASGNGSNRVSPESPQPGCSGSSSVAEHKGGKGTSADLTVASGAVLSSFLSRGK